MVILHDPMIHGSCKNYPDMTISCKENYATRKLYMWWSTYWLCILVVVSNWKFLELELELLELELQSQDYRIQNYKITEL